MRRRPGLRAEVLEPRELTLAELARWRVAVQDEPAYASPFFRPEFVQVCADVVPHARVAVLHRAGAPVGFYPFQLRGGVAQPLAAPLNDYHGLILLPGEREPAFGRLPGLLGAATVRAGGWVGAVQGATRSRARFTMAADLSTGWTAYAAERERTEHKFFKDKRRARRGLEREVGELSLRLDQGGRDHFERLIALKRAQYRRTGEHDVFACGWTRELLVRLLEAAEPGFGGRLSVLEAGGEPVAMEYSLVSGARRHFWFPVYEPSAGRCSPGVLLTQDVMREAAGQGTTWFDFGLSGEPYKKYFANAGEVVHEAEAAAGGWPAALAGAGAAAERFGDRLSQGRVSSLHRRVRRRFDVIEACEASPWGRLAAISGTVLARCARGPRGAGGG